MPWLRQELSEGNFISLQARIEHFWYVSSIWYGTFAPTSPAVITVSDVTHACNDILSFVNPSRRVYRKAERLLQDVVLYGSVRSMRKAMKQGSKDEVNQETSIEGPKVIALRKTASTTPAT